MTSREETVDRTNGALGHLYQALAGLYEQRAKYGKGLRVMGEAIVADIFRLRKEIDDLIGLTDYVAEYGVPPTDEAVDAVAPVGPPATPSANGTPVSDEHSAVI